MLKIATWGHRPPNGRLLKNIKVRKALTLIFLSSFFNQYDIYKALIGKAFENQLICVYYNGFYNKKSNKKSTSS